MDKKGLEKMEYRFLPEFVYGATDGVITTFAIVAGVFGAALNSVIILILGFANLFADGFSMATSDYLSTKSRNDLRKKTNFPKTNALKSAFMTFFAFIIIGFIPLLSFVVAAITKNPYLVERQFVYSVILTFVALGIIGWWRGKISEKSEVKSMIQTILIGGVAALIAFLVGHFIRTLVG